MKRFTVTSAEAGERLDVALAKWAKVSRSQAARIIEAGRVSVNDAVQKSKYTLNLEDTVTLAPEPAAAPLDLPDIPVRYEDDDLLIIDKPAGMLTHIGNGKREGTVADAFRDHVEDDDQDRPGIVHRLDRDTSGLLIIAKNPASKVYLQGLFKKRDIHKTYLALVVGHPSEDEALIDLPLGRSTRRRTQHTVDLTGRAASTRYKVIANYPAYSLLEVQPLTGRTHQIRAHMRAVGHPVAGDVGYGAPSGPAGLKRQFLHAAHLQFISPSGKAIDVESPLPPDLAAVLDHLKPQ